MTNTKIVFFDIDETLHRKDTAFMPESAKLAIRKLRARGIHTGIATGRCAGTLPNYIREMLDAGDFDVLVSINGQYNCHFSENGQEILSHYPMETDYIEQVIHYVQSQGLSYAGVSTEGMIAPQNTPRMTQALTGIGTAAIDPNFPKNNTIYQMLLFLDEAEQQRFEQTHLVKAGYETLRWHELAIDLLHKNGAKAQGIRDVCQAMGIAIENSMAFGDGHNDLDMMHTVGIGVAMGDALPSIQTAASYVTGTVEEDGIYHALKHFGLIDDE